MADPERSSSDDSFIKYWESKKRHWILSVVLAVLYGFTLSFLFNYFRTGNTREVWQNQEDLFLYAIPFAIIWFFKGLWQRKRMEKRYQELKDNEHHSG
jgi:hypothetical protein